MKQEKYMTDMNIFARWGVDRPLFGFSHSLPVVRAVTLAGGIGVWGATRNTPDEIEAGLAVLAETCQGRPFGVDLVLPKNMPETEDRSLIEAQIPEGHIRFIEGLRAKYAVADDGQSGLRSRFLRSQEMGAKQLQAVIDSAVPIVAMGVGSPQEAVAQAKAARKTVISLVGSPKHARKAIAAGADILVAQGYDAGAHTGEIGTFSLVPQVVAEAGDVPVVVAGGVATSAHVAAALALGGVGVWVGTAWLFSEENDTDERVLAKLIAAGSDDTVRSRADSGKTLRQIKTAWTTEWSADGAPTPLPMPYQDILVGDFLGAAQRQGVEPLLKSEAGQSVAYFDRRATVAEIMDGLLGDYRARRVAAQRLVPTTSAHSGRGHEGA
ncbi:NAD(P)H-dependent flavin oxidoreductase [Tomitella cavernea]|uniref:NAD(P)H-dependent flavin oxidoreductase n=1 Tax=Tomitella cavernea TaxID=1387982 RepID=UPI0019049568|nr:nitronate monooxygenase [Tomitella cavernea]